MANWKKVIVSGSKAELQQVTASAGVQILNVTQTASNADVLVIDSDGNIHKALQTTVAGALSQASAFATMSVSTNTAGTYTANAISASSSPDNITFVKGGSINIDFSSSNDANGSGQKNFVKLKAVTRSLAQGTNVTISSTATTSTINAVTKSLAAGTNISLSSTGATTTITAVTKSIVAGDNVTISNSAASTTINAATSSVQGTGNISVAQVGNVFTVSSTATTEGADANFANITASGHISASSTTGNHVFGGTATFGTISASRLNIETLTELNTSTTVNGPIVFNGFALFEDDVQVRSGSTQFGSGSNPAVATHEFTGSTSITGSLNVSGPVVGTSFQGDGALLTNLNLSQIGMADLTDGHGISDFTYNGSGAAVIELQLSGSTLSTGSGGIYVTENSISEDHITTSVAGTGIAGGNGTALSLNIQEVADANINVALDEFIFIDQDQSGGTKKERFTDLATAQASTGIAAVNGQFTAKPEDFIGVDAGGAYDKGISASLSDGGTVQHLELAIHTLPTEVNTKEDFIAFADVSDANNNKKVTGINFITNILGTGFTLATDGESVVIDPANFPVDSVPVASLAEDSITIGDITITLGQTTSSLTGLTNIDLTSGNHTILDGFGTGNTLTIGANDNTVAFANDVTVAGNFTVNGTVTTIDTETLKVEDNFIDLNSNISGSGAGAPSEDAGISVKRGNLADANLYWDETDDRWSTSHTNLAGAATDAAVTAYLATVVSNTSNPSAAPVDGASATTKVGQFHVNTNTQEIWIYA